MEIMGGKKTFCASQTRRVADSRKNHFGIHGGENSLFQNKDDFMLILEDIFEVDNFVRLSAN